MTRRSTDGPPGKHPDPIRIFVSYAREDERYVRDLRKYLAPLVRTGTVAVWSDEHIQPGEPWDRRISEALARSELILFLVSPDLLASEYCCEQEIPKAIELHRAGRAQIIPIYIRPCARRLVPLADLQALPRSGVPVSSSKDPDDVWKSVIESLLDYIPNSSTLATTPHFAEATDTVVVTHRNPNECATKLSSTQHERVLIIDSDPSTGERTADALRRAGCVPSKCLTAQDAINALSSTPYALVVLDLSFAGPDLFRIMTRLRALQPDTMTVVFTERQDFELTVSLLGEDYYEFVGRPSSDGELIYSVRRALKRRSRELNAPGNCPATQQVGETPALSAVQNLAAQAGLDALDSLRLAAEYRDDDTHAHCQRIGVLSRLIAEQIGKDEKFCALIELSAPLHDLGKIGIPDGILHKPGPLTRDERRIFERHCEIGRMILLQARSEVLQMAREICWTHHEKWSGSGYPQGLAGHKIPLESRIVSLVDVMDALLCERCYKPAYPFDKTMDILSAEADKHFDPSLVEALLQMKGDVKRVYGL